MLAFVGCCALRVLCCLWFWWLLCVALCVVLFVASCLLFVPRCSLVAVCWLLVVGCVSCVLVVFCVLVVVVCCLSLCVVRCLLFVACC